MTSILTALSMLAHVLMGCCWHHEHPCAAPPAEVAVVAVVAAAAGPVHVCECSRHHDSEEPAAPEHDETPCDEDRCVTAFRDSGADTGVDDALPTIVAELVPPLVLVNPSAAPALPLQDFASPLRTHLLLQILLI